MVNRTANKRTTNEITSINKVITLVIIMGSQEVINNKEEIITRATVNHHIIMKMKLTNRSYQL